MCGRWVGSVCPRSSHAGIADTAQGADISAMSCEPLQVALENALACWGFRNHFRLKVGFGVGFDCGYSFFGFLIFFILHYLIMTLGGARFRYQVVAAAARAAAADEVSVDVTTIVAMVMMLIMSGMLK